MINTNEDGGEKGTTNVQGKSAGKYGKVVDMQGNLATANGFDLLWETTMGDGVQPSSSNRDQGGKEDGAWEKHPAHSL